RALLQVVPGELPWLGGLELVIQRSGIVVVDQFETLSGTQLVPSIEDHRVALPRLHVADVELLICHLFFSFHFVLWSGGPDRRSDDHEGTNAHRRHVEQPRRRLDPFVSGHTERERHCRQRHGTHYPRHHRDRDRHLAYGRHPFSRHGGHGCHYAQTDQGRPCQEPHGLSRKVR